MQKLSPNPSCGIMIWWRAGLLQNTHAVFLSILHRRKDTASPFDNQESRHWEKLPVHHQAWLLSDDITSPNAHHKTVHLSSLPTRSTIDLLLTFASTVVLVTEYFVIGTSFDPWKLKRCCIQWRSLLLPLMCVVYVVVEWNFTPSTQMGNYNEKFVFSLRVDLKSFTVQ